MSCCALVNALNASVWLPSWMHQSADLLLRHLLLLVKKKELTNQQNPKTFSAPLLAKWQRSYLRGSALLVSLLLVPLLGPRTAADWTTLGVLTATRGPAYRHSITWGRSRAGGRLTDCRMEVTTRDGASHDSQRSRLFAFRQARSKKYC